MIFFFNLNKIIFFFNKYKKVVVVARHATIILNPNVHVGTYIKCSQNLLKV